MVTTITFFCRANQINAQVIKIYVAIMWVEIKKKKNFIKSWLFTLQQV